MSARQRSILVLICLFLLNSSQAEIITVDDDGSAAFNTIQEAISAASTGDTIRVLSGTYVENIDVNKPVWLIGEDANSTIIDGNGTGDVVSITTNNIIVKGFTIRNCGSFYCGLKLNQSHRNSIICNKISNEYGYGIKLTGSNSNTIIDNEINSNWNEGIFIEDSDETLVSKNQITSNGSTNGDFGIVIEDSDHTMVLDNTVTSNGGGVCIKENSHHNEIRGNYVCENNGGGNGNGIVIGTSPCGYRPSYNTIVSNTVTSNHWDGIELIETSHNTICDNDVNDNSYNGLWLDDAGENVIKNNVVMSNGANGILFSLSSSSDNVSIIGNEIHGNSVSGIFLNKSSYCTITDNVISSHLIMGTCPGLCAGIVLGPYSNNNTIAGNRIINNKWGIGIGGSFNKIYHNIFVKGSSDDVRALNSTTVWDDGDSVCPRGNYWTDYEGVDANSDGIGDTPYQICDEPNNIDNYPLVLVSYKITTDQLGHWPLPWPEMGNPYKLIIDLTNYLPYDVNFTGVDQAGAWPSYRVWGLNYDINNCVLADPCTIRPDTTAHFELGFTNHWDWIKPNDWEAVILDLALGEISTGCSIVSFIEACYDAKKAVPALTYTFEPPDSSRPYINFSTDVTVHVPLSKQLCLYLSLELQALSITSAIYSIFAGPASSAFGVLSIGCTVGSLLEYNAAVDPDENYTAIFEPKTITIDEVNALPEGIEKRLAQAALELASLEQAYEQSYIRYDGARIACCDDCNEYMAMQLGAARKYKAMAIEKLREVQLLTGIVIETHDIPQLSQNDINDFRQSILRNGIGEIQEKVLEQMGLNSAKLMVKRLLLDATDPAKITPEQSQLYMDPNTLHKYEHAISQVCYMEDYSLEVTAEAKNLTTEAANDVAITDLWPSDTTVEVEDSLEIHVRVENHGTNDVTNIVINAYADSLPLGPNTIANLPSGANGTLIFGWDANAVGCYTIRAEVITDINDQFPADNTYTGVTVKVSERDDIISPSKPCNLHCTNVTHNTVSLAWDASPETDLAGYMVYRDSELAGLTAGTSYTDTGLSPCSWYSYTVSAYDIAGNNSSQSDPCSVETIGAVYLLSPDGGETLRAGMDYSIQWESECSGENVRLEYSADNGQNWIDINTVDDVNSYQWQVPDVNSPQCLVRISDPYNADVCDTSYCVFRIYICQRLMTADIEGDCHVNFTDFVTFAGQWLADCCEPDWCQGADLDMSGKVEWPDVNDFAGQWLECGNPFDTLCECWPDCWNWATQCHGDVDGDGYVGANDRQILIAVLNKDYPDPDYNPCADFNRDGSVDTLDFDICSAYLHQFPEPNCPAGAVWPPAM